jgi:hypothetical protein
LWEEWDAPMAEIEAVAERFVRANAYNPEIASLQFNSSKFYSEQEMTEMGRCQVPDPGNADAGVDSDRGENL